MVAVRLSRLNQLTRRSRSIAAWAIASAKWLLPVPDGPTRTRFSARPIQSRLRSAHWASGGIAEAAGSQASKVLPDGSRAALRWCSRVERSRPAASSANSVVRTRTWSQPSAAARSRTAGPALLA